MSREELIAALRSLSSSYDAVNRRTLGPELPAMNLSMERADDLLVSLGEVSSGVNYRANGQLKRRRMIMAKGGKAKGAKPGGKSGGGKKSGC